MGIRSIPIPSYKYCLSSMVLGRSIYDKIGLDVVRYYPKEVCGVLLGTISGTTGYVKSYVRLKTLEVLDRKFWFDENEWMSAIINGRKRGLKYIGIVHSHPNGSAVPSIEDFERMIECPGEVWLILSYDGSRIEYTAWSVCGYDLMTRKLDVIIN